MTEELFENVDALEEEEVVEREIKSALRNSGYEEGSSSWNRNLIRWKGYRVSNPTFYKKFVSMD